jgi:hypothetical protein
LRILIVSVFCFGAYLFSQSVLFGNKINTSVTTTGVICSFATGLGFHFYYRNKEKNK